MIKTSRASSDPDFEEKKNHVLELYDMAAGKAELKEDHPTVVICLDEFEPLNLSPRPGRQWAPAAGKGGAGDRPNRRRRRTTFTRAAGVRHLLAAYALDADKLYGHVKLKKDSVTILTFCHYARSPHRPEVRITIVLDNFSPHLSTTRDSRVGDWALKNNVELACVLTNASWFSRIKAQLQAMRYFTRDRADHRSNVEQNSMIRRCIIWGNRHAQDESLHELATPANVA